MHIRLDLSFRVVFVGFAADLGRIQSDLGRIQLGLGRIQSDWGRIQLGLRVKFQSGRWTFSMVVSKIQWGY